MSIIYILGNLVGRFIINYIIVWLFCLCLNKFKFRLAFKQSTRWHSWLIILLMTLLGLGASFKRSWIYLKNAGYESMIFLHGDDQADLQDYFYFENQHLAHVAFGARFMKSSKIINYSKKRHWMNLFLNSALSVITGKKIWELGSGLNVYKLNSISNDDIMMLSNHIAFDLELLIFCIKVSKA